MNKTLVLVSGVLRNSQNQILLLLRGEKNKSYRGNWQLPEGKIEFGEQPEIALKREIKEETNFSIISSRLLFSISSVIKVQGEEYQIIRLVYEVRWKGDSVRLDDDHEDYQWFMLADVQGINQTIDGLKEIIKRL